MKKLLSLLIATIILLWSINSFALNVVATLPDLAAISQAVGGKNAHVVSLANPNEDPHHVDPRPNKIISLNQADVLVMIGLELEDAWLKPLVKQARNANIDVGGRGRVVTSDFINLIEKPQGKIERSEGDIHPGGNPHFNFDPRAGAKIALKLQKKFSELDPEHAEEYKANTRKFLTSLRNVMTTNYKRFQALPSDKRKVVTYHKSLGYLLDFLGIKEIGNIEPKPGIPPNPAHVARLLQTMKGNNTTVVLQEKFYPRSSSAQVAGQVGGSVLLIDAGTNFAQGETYLTHIENMCNQIYDALAKPAAKG